MPLSAARDVFARTPYVRSVLLATTDMASLARVQAGSDAMLRGRNGLTADDTASYSITNPAPAIGRVQSLLSRLLGGTASISVLIGGIGITNIRAVSAGEQNREVGVRRAISNTGPTIETTDEVHGPLSCCWPAWHRSTRWPGDHRTHRYASGCARSTSAPSERCLSST